MAGDAFPGAPAAGGPALCLDFSAYARRVFGSGEPEWFDTPTLMAQLRQAQQSLRADWVLLPLLDWAAAWWAARRPGADAGRSALRVLKTRLEDPALRAALLDVLRALHGVIGSAGLALQLAGGAQWLAWAGDDDADADDAEEALVHLAALLHGLAGSGIGAVVVEQANALPEDPAEHFAALTNAAHHHGWPCALCAAEVPDLPAGFDAAAGRAPAPGQGAWLPENSWQTPACCRTPRSSSPAFRATPHPTPCWRAWRAGAMRADLPTEPRSNEMMLYDTDWVAELARLAAADEVFQKKARGFDAVYQYVVKPPKNETDGEPRCFWLTFPACTQFGMGKHDKPTYTMTTSYEVMHDVLTGKTNAVMALTMRKVFVAGDLMRLLRFTGAINRIVELMQRIPARAEGALAAIG